MSRGEKAAWRWLALLAPVALAALGAMALLWQEPAAGSSVAPPAARSAPAPGTEVLSFVLADSPPPAEARPRIRLTRLRVELREIALLEP